MATLKLGWVDSMLNTESFQVSIWLRIVGLNPEAVLSNVGGRFRFTNVNPPEMSLSVGAPFVHEF